MKLNSKGVRQKTIQKIIEEENVCTQMELVDLLNETGFNVTQATVSRDIKDMGLVKVPASNGLSKYSMPINISLGNIEERMQRLFNDNAISINHSGNIIIIRTLPGTANALAVCIDQSNWKEIIGCIAGDDTIMLVINEDEDVITLAERLEVLIR